MLSACGASPAPAPAPATLGNSLGADTATPTPTPSIVGEYRARHEIGVVCDAPDGWCPELVDDTLTIRDAGDGRITVAIELVQTNAHTCGFDGTLAPTPTHDAGDDVTRWRFADHGEDGPCELTLEVSAGDITISSDGCRYYCGARASLDATFARPPAGG